MKNPASFIVASLPTGERRYLSVISVPRIEADDGTTLRPNLEITKEILR
jgi:hypothetical protein